jgi:hypothetical protein
MFSRFGLSLVIELYCTTVTHVQLQYERDGELWELKTTSMYHVIVCLLFGVRPKSTGLFRFQIQSIARE